MKKLTLTLAALGVAATGGVAYAEPSFSVTGMIRQEIANNTGGANQHTSWGSPFNGKMTTSHLGNLAPLDDGVNGLAGLCGLGLCVGTDRSNVTAQEPDWTQWATRLELDVQGRLTENVSLYMKLRGYAENPQHDFLRSYDYFGKASIANGVDHPR